VLVCCGGISGGFSLFIKDGKLHWEHNYYNEVHYRASSTDTIPPGHHVLSAEVRVDQQGKFGTGGAVTLRLDKKTIGEGRFEQQVAGYFTVNETFDVGCDTVSPVSDLYQSPFALRHDSSRDGGHHARPRSRTWRRNTRCARVGDGDTVRATFY
jgi:arylsulfatase